MSSNQSEKSHSWQYGDRSSRQWDSYDDRREDWRKPPRSGHGDSHHKYSGDRHGSTERPSRRREYSTSPSRAHSRDSLSRDWGRESPVRRPPSPPEKRQRRFTECENDTDYRYKRVLEDGPSRHLPDSFARGHTTKDLKRTLSQEEDSKYRETTQDLRQRYLHEESTSRQLHDNGTSRRFIGTRDRNGYELNWGHSGESAQSPERLAKPREMRDSAVIDPADSRRGFPLRPSPGQSFQVDANHQRPAAAAAAASDQTKSTMGFQRFLEVLNKGVNVAALSEIVTQSPAELKDQPLPTKAPKNIKGEPWAVNREVEQHESRLDADLWSKLREPQELDSPQCKEFPLADKAPAQKVVRERRLSETSTPVTPSVSDKVTETSHEENKQKHEQMLNILEAIGVNLGSEELDQMSLRIQQRLYGRKEGDGTRDFKPDLKPGDSPRRRSGSPSSRSSFSPPAEEYCSTADLYDDSKRGECLIQIQPDPQYCQQSSSSSALQVNKESQEIANEFSQNPTYPLPVPAPPPVLPPYPNCLPPPLPLPYPPPPPMLPLAVRSPVFPHLHPFLPRPPVPPMFPEFLGPMMHPHPGPIGNPPPPRNLPFSTTQQSKGPSRPRCLQVVKVEKALKKTSATGNL